MNQYQIRTEAGLSIENAQNVIIDELNIKNCSYENQNNTGLSGLIMFNNISNIYINTLNIENVQSLGQIIQIFSSTNVTINNLTISNCKLSEAYESIFNRARILNFTSVGVLKAENYYNDDDATLSYNNQIDFNFLNMTNINSNQDFNSSSTLIYIQTINSNFKNLYCQQLILNNAFITIQSINQTQITNSKFTNFNFMNQNFGGILNLSGKNFVLENVVFQDCLSLGVSNAINIIQSSYLLVENSKFIDLNCFQSTINSNQCQSGAVYLSQVGLAQFKDSLFKNCSSSSFGGALYANNFNMQGSISLIQCVFQKCQSLYKSGGALYVQNTQNFTIVSSILLLNKAQSERGGAIAIQATKLYVLQATIFQDNYAQVGGSIWYDQQSSIQITKESKFVQNNANCYGKNIGSYPRSIKRVDSQNLVIENNVISQISSGNQLPYKYYFNLFDEENNPIKCFNINNQHNNPSPDLIKEFDVYNLQIDLKSNTEIGIKQEQVLIKNNILQLFEFNPILIYKGSQTQLINIVSNNFLTTDQNNGPLNIQLQLNFRDCQRGEIIQVQNEFITCYECPQDRYSIIIPNMITDKNQLQCQKCPTQAQNCSGSNIILKDGYWRSNRYSDNIYSCNSLGCKEDNINSKFGCSIGYVGPLCDSCDSKADIWHEIYSRDSNQKCKTCKSLSFQYFYFVVVFICYVFYITYSINNQFDKKILLFILDTLTKLNILITSKTRAHSNDGFLKIKIFINYFQILQIFFVFIRVPIQFQYFIDAFGHPVKMTISSFDCFLKMNDKFPLWPSLSKLIISGLFCQEIEQKYYLISQLDYECYTDYHIAYISALLIPLIIVWCLLIPFYYYKKLKSFQNSDKKKDDYLQVLIYGVLFKSYKVDYSYWEIRNKEQTFIRSTNVTNISYPKQIPFLKKQISHQERFSIDHKNSFDFYSNNQEDIKSNNSPQLLINDQQQFIFDSTLIQESDQQVCLPQPFKRSFFCDKNYSPTKFFQPK
ncbi:transmembrane protein, putative (macronuclear) [Tetrahymena thermophila SB210]|uniref:Transmembrane protein, putative n=1 Tax=Tetrahymena thermophila (strain SB210) TaxID=312017 RepID=Q229N6_TETTS|nr:transmembrane protein, putative [Tetrahymena thermophila SB210]EAR82002.2 transmembrane protein, putative [Tetrahymena thermophila SB210]|eukprot:XP_001029665.2 transmembrane protein, putative [Tetrahymena thermophila SB210]